MIFPRTHSKSFRKDSDSSQEIFLQPIDQHYWHEKKGSQDQEQLFDDYEFSKSFKNLIDYSNDSTDSDSDLRSLQHSDDLSEPSLWFTKTALVDNWRLNVSNCKKFHFEKLKVLLKLREGASDLAVKKEHQRFLSLKSKEKKAISRWMQNDKLQEGKDFCSS